MACFPQPHPVHRAPRYFVAQDMQVIICSDRGQGLTGRLRALSATGGRASFRATVAPGTFVEVTLSTRFGEVNVLAEMLKAVASSGGWQQAFRFVALSDEDHQSLRKILAALR